MCILYLYKKIKFYHQFYQKFNKSWRFLYMITSINYQLPIRFWKLFWHDFVHIFGSDRSSRNDNLSACVRPFQVCLGQSIFIILAQIFKQSVRNKSAVSEHSESTQRALREQSDQRAIREHSEHQNKSQYSQSL